MPLNLLQCTGQPPANKHLAPNVIFALGLGNPLPSPFSWREGPSIRQELEKKRG